MSGLYATPGVIVEEKSTLPSSVVPVETAIPAFIGYTEKAEYRGRSLALEPTQIKSMLEYRERFGGPFMEKYKALQLEALPDDTLRLKAEPFGTVEHSHYRLYYALELFFQNGGGPCYIVSVGTYSDASAMPQKDDLANGIMKIRKVDEPTLLVIPEAIEMVASDDIDNDQGNATPFYDLYKLALQQCAELQDRFTIMDTIQSGNLQSHIDRFRQGIGTNNLSYGAVYYPHLESSLSFVYNEEEIGVTGVTLKDRHGNDIPAGELRLFYDLSDASLDSKTLPLGVTVSKKEYFEDRSLFHTNGAVYNTLYREAISILSRYRVPIGPSSVMAGIYANVDNTRGVFKAPANVSLTGIVRPLVRINDRQQEQLNVHASGKSINAIRTFKNKGDLVWGGRTLDGNNNEWKYISVRRFFIFVEESTKKASERFVFEPNDINTWTKVKG